MKSTKRNVLLHSILVLLSENEYISVAKLAMILDTSNSTIRRMIEILEGILQDTGYGKIIKTPRLGLHLQIDNKEKITELFYDYELKSMMTGEYQIYKYLILILSAKNNRITINELSEKTFDSVSVVRKKLEVCEEWLNLFELHLNIKKNSGVSVEGNEENIRLAIKHIAINNEVYTVDESIQYFAKGINLDLLKKCISLIESEWNFKFAEESFNSMLIYASLAISRSSFTILNISESEGNTVKKYNEYNWSKSLFSMIEKQFNVQINDNEIIYFAIQLLCSYLIHSEYFEENNAYKYDIKLKDFVRKIISVVSEVMNVDLNQDNELYYGLLNHIRPAIFRMRFEKHSTQVLTDFIKEEYKHTFRVSWALSILFEEYYDISISSTELSYITLYIQSSLERSALPINMAFVTELGMGLNQIFCNKIKIAIPKIEKITIYSLHEFNEQMIDEFDLIITTSNLNISNKKIIQISSLLNDKGISLIKERITELNRKKMQTKRKFDVSCHYLFDPHLIFTNVHVKDKNELISFLSSQLVKFGFVTKQYENSIYKREEKVSTYIGNGVAIPHGNSSLANDSKVVIATLDDAILWNTEDKVNVVFLLAFRMNNKNDSERIQLFYKGFLEIIETDEKLDMLRSLPSNELYKYLLQ